MALGIAHAQIKVGLRRRGENISVDLSLFVLLYTVIRTSCTNLNLMIFFKTENKNILLTVQKFLSSTKSPHFPFRGKIGQLSKRKRELCWSFYVTSICFVHVYCVGATHCVTLAGRCTTLTNPRLLTIILR